MTVIAEWAILQLIESRKATSQVQLAHALNIPANTIHGIIKRLLAEGCLIIEGTEKTRRGRPIQHYRVCRSGVGTRVLAIQWLGSVWHAGVFSNRVVIGNVQRKDLPPLRNKAEVLTVLRQVHDFTLQQAGLAPSDIAGTILAINAVPVSSEQVLSSSVIPWLREFTGSDFSGALPGQVQVRSQTPFAQAELRARTRDGVRSLVMFSVGDGVSAHGLSLDEILATPQYFRGELGHVVVDPRGPICGCGHRGCLEACISGGALLRRLQKDVQNGIQTHLKEVQDKSPYELFNQMERLDAVGQDAYTRTLVREFIDWCAWGISVVTNLFQPDVIVVGGYGLEGRTAWLERIRVAARALVLHGESEALRLEFPRLSMEDHLGELAALFDPHAGASFRGDDPFSAIPSPHIATGNS